ncbi:TPA: DNA/RNA non-specific endonuclease, partial [Staphylococcus aureus]
FINRPFKENGDWYNLEKEWQEFLNSGNEVKNIKMEVKYSGNSKRPSIFKVRYEINNKRNVKTIYNI